MKLEELLAAASSVIQSTPSQSEFTVTGEIAVPAKPEFNVLPEIKKSHAGQWCICCKQKIEPGEMIQAIRMPGRHRNNWVHPECTEAGNAVCTVEVPVVPAAPAEPVEVIEIIDLIRPDGVKVRITDAVHPAFKEVCVLANHRKNIFLPGPSGCGKSHLGRQVAEALGLRFGSISCSAGMSESQLLGRMIPQGTSGSFEFLGTEFLDCYESGGLFLFDEMDAADSNVLLVINSALANGTLSVPSRHGKPVAAKHADFVCIAAANTYGKGADRMYCGRNELDEATLDRFRIGTVPMDYDEKLEKKLCPDAELFGRLRAYRMAIVLNRLERIVSTRFMIDAYEMVSEGGWDFDKIDEKLFAGWRDDEIKKVRGF